MEEDHSCKEWELVHHLANQLCKSGEAEEVSPEIVDAICQGCRFRAHRQPDPTLVNITLVVSLSACVKVIPDSYTAEDFLGLPLISSLSHQDLKNEQQADPALREVIYQLETGEKIPRTVRQEWPEFPLLLREWN